MRWTGRRPRCGVVQNLQQQTSGVSIDEEMIALTQSQTAYAAAAQIHARRCRT